MSQKGNQEAFLKAMSETFGNISESCRIAEIDRSLPYKWEKEDPEFAVLFRDSNFEETRLDMIEGKLTELAMEKNPVVLIFLAKTKGKKRGYVERSEITGADGKDLNYTVTLDIGGTNNNITTIQESESRPGSQESLPGI